jgi:hypothetical protein
MVVERIGGTHRRALVGLSVLHPIGALVNFPPGGSATS